MLKEGIITPSTSNICSAAFLVGKKNGKKRLVVYYTAINKVNKPDHYPLPIVSTILNQLQEREIFSKLDLTSGYFHVKLHPDTIPISSFVVPQGVYAFKRLPFGLSSGPQAFQRSMDSLFGDDKDVFLYLDDILIASKNYSDNYESLKKVLSKVLKFTIMINWEKCLFCQNSISFLGNKIEKNTVSADLKNFNTLEINSIPTTLKELRSLIGYVNYFREYVPRISKLLAPITEKLKSKYWNWTAYDSKIMKEIEI